MERHELTEPQWERLQPLLPPQKPHTGRPKKDHRLILAGIIWVLRTGAPWANLPTRLGRWKTVASRFDRWQQAGIWDRILTGLQQEADADGAFDWTLHVVDRTTIRAHHHAAGAKKGTQNWKPSAGVEADSAPRFTSAPRATASRSSLSSPRASGMNRPWSSG
jgi:transposase